MIGTKKRSLHQRVIGRLRREVAILRARAGNRITGGSEFEYWASLDHVLPGKPLDARPTPKRLAQGALQFEYLKSLGLQPRHVLLDYGCSVLRTAMYVVPYLEPGHYVGADVSRQAMRRGARMLTEQRISRERYHLVAIRSPELAELEGFRFDFVFASSVAQYLSDEDLAKLFGSLRGLVNEGATLFVSFPDESWIDVLKRKGNYYRAPQTMLAIARSAGFVATVGDKAESGYPLGPHLLMKPAPV